MHLRRVAMWPGTPPGGLELVCHLIRPYRSTADRTGGSRSPTRTEPMRGSCGDLPIPNRSASLDPHLVQVEDHAVDGTVGPILAPSVHPHFAFGQSPSRP